MSTSLDVKKTYKLYIGGKFPRSESGRYLPATSAKGEHLDNFAYASRKDFRDAVVAARSAVAGWGKASAYNRGQILYRAAEMLQNRAGELVNEIARSTGVSATKAKREVTLAIDRSARSDDSIAEVFARGVGKIVEGFALRRFCGQVASAFTARKFSAEVELVGFFNVEASAHSLELFF